MIKNLFLPEKIGSYFFFPQRIIGFDIGKTQITATVVHAKGNARTIEQIIQLSLSDAAGATYEERVSLSIAALCKQVGSYDKIVCGISSSVIFFKELTIPFTQREKIAQVLPFEVEALLPFPAEQAVLDFIITNTARQTGTDKEEPTNSVEKSDLIVGAVQKQQLEEYSALFTKAGVPLNKLVIDLFAFYGLYREIPSYRELPGAVALLNIGFSNSRIAFIYNGQLKFIRSIPKGISSIIKPITELGMTPSQAQELLLRYGVQKPDDAAYSTAASTGLKDLLTALTFTTQTFLQRVHATSLTTALISGGGAGIKDISAFIQEHWSAIGSKLQVAPFSVEQLFSQQNYRTQEQKHISPMAAMSVGIALPTPINEASNLLASAGTEDMALLTKQVITGASLITLILLLLIGNSYWQTRTLSNTITKNQKQLIKTLEAEPELKISGIRRVAEAVETTRSRVEEHKKIWGAFASRTRSSFLSYLQKLSTTIDKQAISLDLKKLDITHERINMQGKVRDIPALIILEEELRQANLGTFVSPQEPSFNITIVLKKESEEGN